MPTGDKSDAMRCDAMRCDAMRCDAMRCDDDDESSTKKEAASYDRSVNGILLRCSAFPSRALMNNPLSFEVLAYTTLSVNLLQGLAICLSYKILYLQKPISRQHFPTI